MLIPLAGRKLIQPSPLGIVATIPDVLVTPFGVSVDTEFPYFGPNAPWNIPIAGLAVESDTVNMVSEHYDNSPSVSGNFELNFGDTNGFTYPIYYVADKDGDYPVNATATYANIEDAAPIPFHADWVASDGVDAQLIILDEVTGESWSLFEFTGVVGGVVQCEQGHYMQTGTNEGDIHKVNTPGNYRTKENGFYTSRELGIQVLAMLGLPQEITLGVIKHALMLPISNVAGIGNNNPNPGFVAPAIKMGHPLNADTGTVMGARFHLDVSLADIDSYIDDRGGNDLPSDLTAAMYDSLRIILICLRDYGWIITDTSVGSRFQFEDAKTADWAPLGLLKMFSAERSGREYPKNGVQDFFTKARIKAIVPSDEY